MKKYNINIDGYDVIISNPYKILFPDLNITKIDYLKYLSDISDYLITYCKDRFLTTIRYPDGVNNKMFYQKNLPKYAPEWIKRMSIKDKNLILLNNKATLIWLGNLAALEFHISFDTVKNINKPTYLVFDLDPSEGQNFSQVCEAALLINEVTESLNIKSFVKTSGATGLQIYIPIGTKYDYDTARQLNLFFAKYFVEKYPKIFTIERLVDKRENKLYFDYLQMWKGKSIIAPYSPRATKYATVSMPISWEQLISGVTPKDFNILNAIDIIKTKGDLFNELIYGQINNLDELIECVTN